MKKISIVAVIALVLGFTHIASAATVQENWYDACGNYPTPTIVDPSNPIEVACDINNDGVINGSDYTLVDNHFNMVGIWYIDVPATSTPEVSIGGGYAPISGGASLVLTVGTTFESQWTSTIATYLGNGQWAYSANPNFVK